MGVNFWLVDGARVENVFVCKSGNIVRFNLANLALKLIGAYQRYVRPNIPASCRFEPSCSEFTKQAIFKYGFITGGLKGFIRILRCHPFSGKSGYDPLI